MTTIKNLYPKLTSPISTILNTIDKKFWSPDSINKQDQEIVRKKYNILQSEKLLLFIGRLGLEK